MSPPKDFRQRVISNISWALAQSWGSKLASFVVFFMIARLLSPSDIGMVATGALLISLCEMLVDQGLGDALVQKRDLTDIELNSVLVVSGLLATGAAIALWIIAPYLAALWEMPTLADVIRALSFSLPVTALGICPQALLRKSLQYKRLAIRLFVSTIVSGILSISLAAQGYGVWSLVAQTLCMSLLNTIFVWIKPIWLPSRQFDVTSLRSLYKYGMNVTASRALHFFSTRYIELLISFFLGAAALGIFSVAVRVYQVMLQLFSLSLVDLSLSMFSAINSDKSRVRLIYYKGIALSALFVLPVFAVTAAFSNEICAIVFGEKWREAGNVLFFLSLLGALQSIENHNVPLLKAFGRADYDVAINLTKSITVGIGFITTFHFGLSAVAASLLVSGILVTPLSYYFAGAVASISGKETLRQMSGSLLSTTIVLLLVKGASMVPGAERIDSVWSLILFVGLSFTAYLALANIFAKPQVSLAMDFVSGSPFGGMLGIFCIKPKC